MESPMLVDSPVSTSQQEISIVPFSPSIFTDELNANKMFLAFGFNWHWRWSLDVFNCGSAWRWLLCC